MDGNKMTADPNQKSQSVFGFDSYPQQNIINWNENLAGATYSNVPQQFNTLIPPAVAQLSVQPQIIPNSFSFGTQRSKNSVVHFPFQITNHGFGNRTFTSVRGKRKTDSPPLQTCKQHITEEKMAECMSNLHINSETASTSTESESLRNKRLYMCEEMRKLQSDSILPECLLSRMSNSCTALVLWKPPTRMLPPFLVNDSGPTENNNEERLRDNNVMENELEMDNDLENDIVNNMDMDA